MALPVDFLAFCQLHHDAYQRYVCQVIADRITATHVLQHALGDLVLTWHEALAGPRTAAVAWSTLTRRIRRATATGGAPASALYRFVPAGEADAVVLHRLAGLTLAETADTLGTEAASVAGLLDLFDRRLSATPATALRACWRTAVHGLTSATAGERMPAPANRY
ncbi:hypothetical protein [Streptomyces sp. NPDC014733]|uniref:hypothetical protein n=1 Tax=Streptomyces sp. NPDC014733 TaxID=3364885 RepID=UPI0037027D76